MRIDDFYKNFCTEEFNSKGVISAFKPKYNDNFNFAYDCVDALAELFPDKQALLWTNEDGEEKSFTFSQISKMSSAAANAFLSSGIEKGDRVMLVLKRHYQWWICMMALEKIGAIAVPATNLLMEKDYVYRFKAAGIKAVIATGENDVPLRIETAEKEAGINLKKFVVRGEKEGWLNFDSFISSFPQTLKRVDTLAKEGMLLYFSSGTTGYPKMVLHNHTYAIAHIPTAKHWHNDNSLSIHLSVAETGWGKAAWGKLYGQWFCGSCVFVYDFDKFSPHNLLRVMEKYQVTNFCAPPTIYRFFVKEGMDNIKLPALKYACTAGEALNPEIFNLFEKATGLKIMEGFGQTETVLSLANFVGSQPKCGSMGKPSPLFSVDIYDESGSLCPPGVVGEICIKADENESHPGLFMGYYCDEDKTKEAWHDGFYHTGDTAWKDEDGYFWYEGRTDDVIKASGYRIGPFEVESALMQHPAVLECAVTGAPDPIRGQVVKATIVLTRGHQPSDELITELQDFVKKNTAPYKYPRIIEFVDSLPKTISGKIKRTELRKADLLKK